MTTRRRMLTILAGAAALPAFGTGASAAPHRWKGIALGAEAQIVLDHPNAERLISLALSEIYRLENIFSLYDPESQLSRLNRDGVLGNPAFEMIELLSLCSGLHARTRGAFDPTVQALWSLFAGAFSAGTVPSDRQIANLMQRTGWHHVGYSASQVGFDVAGAALTLNGIAQGYIADKVTQILRDQGVENVLVNTGEIAALGRAPDGRAWQINLSGGDADPVILQNAAIATSAPLGTTFDQDGQVGHILDPRTGYPAQGAAQVSVIAKSAAEADGLSTAFCLMKSAEIDAARGDSQVFVG